MAKPSITEGRPRSSARSPLATTADFYVKHAGFKPLFASAGAPMCVPPPFEGIDHEVVERVERMLAARPASTRRGVSSTRP